MPHKRHLWLGKTRSIDFLLGVRTIALKFELSVGQEPSYRLGSYIFFSCMLWEVCVLMSLPLQFTVSGYTVELVQPCTLRVALWRMCEWARAKCMCNGTAEEREGCSNCRLTGASEPGSVCLA